MINDPQLGKAEYTEQGQRYLLVARGGLNYIRGNSAPFFSVTADRWDVNERGGHKREAEAGGCLHDDILKRLPNLAPLVALHLSYIDGAPMHAEANGWYSLAGYLCNRLGFEFEKYHAGNSHRHFPITPDPETPWKDTEYRNPTPDECLQIFADRCRCPVDEARKVADDCLAVVTDEIGRPVVPFDKSKAREVWRAACEAMRPRWKEEADKVIADFGLVVYGDKWEPVICL